MSLFESNFSPPRYGAIPLTKKEIDSVNTTVIMFRFKFDMAAKRRKKHKNKISGLVISMCYETEIREF
jgi:hypothetical protein